MTPAERRKRNAAILADGKRGLSATAIMQKYDLSQSSAFRLVAAAKRGPNAIPPTARRFDHTAIMEALASGLAIDDVVQRFGCTRSTVYSVRDKMRRAARMPGPILAPAAQVQVRVVAQPAAAEPNLPLIVSLAAAPRRLITCDPVPGGVALLDLVPGHCRWPVGPDAGPALFCGARQIAASSYCGPHRLASLPVGGGRPIARTTRIDGASRSTAPAGDGRGLPSLGVSSLTSPGAQASGAFPVRSI